ncbi:hypothetical protein AJ79_09732 [Helicocarpus griseus UAMH5409]|uniref:Acetoacetate decarboxylase n=1 Tax=Helicocarpus griseus UAMH5409 TaxID=1447875 RepID=A0A2B7WHL1_9EURO|nr:hypothetical protein AJ79_09732 [Helicocarpus griseus UAMH5409]
MSEPSSKPPEGTPQSGANPFTDTPAPWMNMKSQVFSTVARAKGIPEGSYAELEAQSPFADQDASGQYRGLVCSVMIVRYFETPVDPYDEILFVPGHFDVPDKGIKRPRVTRIYVSSKESVYNGRKNWNIPKHLANFKFIPSDKSSAIPYAGVEISLPSTPDQPFVTLDFSPVTILSKPSFPFSTSYVPIDMGLWAPALPESKDWKENGLVGTQEWRQARADISGWARVIRVKGKLGDGQAFPDLKLGGLWVYINDARVSFVTVEA